MLCCLVIIMQSKVLIEDRNKETHTRGKRFSRATNFSFQATQVSAHAAPRNEGQNVQKDV